MAAPSPWGCRGGDFTQISAPPDLPRLLKPLLTPSLTAGSDLSPLTSCPPLPSPPGRGQEANPSQRPQATPPGLHDLECINTPARNHTLRTHTCSGLCAASRRAHASPETHLPATERRAHLPDQHHQEAQPLAVSPVEGPLPGGAQAGPARRTGSSAAGASQPAGGQPRGSCAGLADPRPPAQSRVIRPAGVARPCQSPVGPALQPQRPDPPAPLAQRRWLPPWSAPSASQAMTTSSRRPRSSPAHTSSAWSAWPGWRPPSQQAGPAARLCPAHSAGSPQPCLLLGPLHCAPATSCRPGCQHTCDGRSPCGWRAPSCAAACHPPYLALESLASCVWMWA